MRLGIDGRELRGGVYTGIGRYVIEVLRAAARAGWECVVYTDQRTRMPDTLPGVTVRVLEDDWTLRWDQLTLPRQLAQSQVSVFLSPYYKGPLWAPCPVVLTIHDLFFVRYLGRRRPVYDTAITCAARVYARRAAGIIADSEYSKRAIVERLGVEPTKVRVIPIALGADFTPTPLTDALRRRYGIHGPYILYLGNFKPHKNLPRLLGVYARLPAELRATHALVLAGGDTEHRPTLQGLVQELGLAGCVHFPGPIAEADLPALYSGCTLYVQVSLEEGFGLPPLEAMACGAPVVASNRAALPEVVGDAGVLVDPEDEEGIADGLIRVLSLSKVRDTLRQLGLARAHEFCPARTSERVLALLREVSEGHDARG